MDVCVYIHTVRLCCCRPYIYFNAGETQLQNDTDGILIVLLCSRKPSPTRKTMTPSVAIPVFVVCLQAFLFPSSSSSSFCISIGRTGYWNWIEQATAQLDCATQQVTCFKTRPTGTSQNGSRSVSGRSLFLLVYLELDRRRVQKIKPFVAASPQNISVQPTL